MMAARPNAFAAAGLGRARAEGQSDAALVASTHQVAERRDIRDRRGGARPSAATGRNTNWLEQLPEAGAALNEHIGLRDTRERESS
jgi:hypothetical protein